jgi:hypothetical protein
MSRAEYMRNYRASRKPPEAAPMVDPRDERIVELEAEVKHLKAELAKRLIVAPGVSKVRIFDNEPGFNSRPFTPAPKHRP